MFYFLWFYNTGRFSFLRGRFRIIIDAGADSCPDCRSKTSIAAIEFYCNVCHSCKRTGEYIAQKEIGFAYADNVRINTILPHDIQTIAERKSNAFLHGTNHMTHGMNIKVNIMKMSADDLVVQHSLCTIAKR